MSGETKAFLAAIVILVLAIVFHDVWRTPDPASGAPPAAPLEPKPEIRRGLDKTPLLYAGEYLQSLSVRLNPALVTARASLDGVAAETAGFVLNHEGEVVIALAGFAERWDVRTGTGETAMGDLVGLDAVHGIALLRTDLTRPTPFVEIDSADVATPAATLVGLRAGPTRPDLRMLTSPGSSEALQARLRDERVSAGEVIVNLDGRLTAFVGSTVGTTQALLAELVLEIAGTLRERGRHPHPWIGVDWQTISGPLRSHFPEGLFVAVHVEPDSPAAWANMRAGMTFTEARAGATVATTGREVEALVVDGPDEIVFVSTDAGGGAITVHVMDRQTPFGFEPVAAGRPGLRPVPPPPGIPVAVSPAGTAALFGLETGDLIEAMDLQPVRTIRQLERAVSVPGHLLTVRREHRRFFVALPTEDQVPASEAAAPAGEP
jgi:S1-C subfamily serine protease